MISSNSVLESSPLNSQEEELQMLHSLLVTEKWLFLKLLGYYRIFLCWAFLLFRNRRSCRLVPMKAILSSMKLFFGTKLHHCAQKWLRCFFLIPILWNWAWIVLGHNTELQNPASSFKYHHVSHKEYVALEQAIDSLHRYLLESSPFAEPLFAHCSSKTTDQNLCGSCWYLGLNIFAFQVWNRDMQTSWGMAFFSYVIPMLYPGGRVQPLSQTSWKIIIYSSEIWLYFYLLK